MHLESFPSYSDFVEASCSFIVETCKAKHDEIHIALSGGSTPRPVYEILSQRTDIQNVSFWQVDERYVPQTHEDSNYKLIVDSLIRNLKNFGKPALFHYFDTSLSIENCLKQYEKEMKENISQGFDICILGIGPDGHTASLFPHSPALHFDKTLTAHTVTDAFTIHDRLTITFEAILKSRKLLLLLKGKDKKNILKDLLHSKKTVDALPAKKLLKHPDLTIYFSEV